MLGGLRTDASLHALWDITLLGRDSWIEHGPADGMADRHALVVHDAGWRVVALAPGVRVNGVPVRDAALSEGDVLELGAARFVFTHDVLETVLEPEGWQAMARDVALPGVTVFLRCGRGPFRVLTGSLALAESAAHRRRASADLGHGYVAVAVVHGEDGARVEPGLLEARLEGMRGSLEARLGGLPDAHPSSPAAWYHTAERPCAPLEAHRLYGVRADAAGLTLTAPPPADAAAVVYVDRKHRVWAAPLDPACDFEARADYEPRFVDRSQRIQGFHEGSVTVVTSPPRVADQLRGDPLIGLTVSTCVCDPRTAPFQPELSASDRAYGPPVQAAVGHRYSVGEILAARKSLFTLFLDHEPAKLTATKQMIGFFAIPLLLRGAEHVVIHGAGFHAVFREDGAEAQLDVVALARAAGERLEALGERER